MKELFNALFRPFFKWQIRRSRKRHARWLKAVKRKNQELGYTREFK